MEYTPDMVAKILHSMGCELDDMKRRIAALEALKKILEAQCLPRSSHAFEPKSTCSDIPMNTGPLNAETKT